MEDDFKHTLVVKGSVVAKQQKFSKTNLKAMKVALENSLKEAPQVDLDTINKRKKKFSKAITDEDQGLNDFRISKRIPKIMAEQQQKKKTRKKSQKEEDEEELLARNHKTKKRLE